MPPSSSPPLASGLLGLSSSPAQTSSIIYPGNFRQPPATTTLPTDSSPPFDETDEFSLLARLEQKRCEIEAEIGVFRVAKEAEYLELEKRLREAQSNKKRKRENGGASNVSGGGKEKVTDATHATAGATPSDDGGTSFTGKGHKVESINYGALGLGGPKSNDKLKLEFPDCQKQIGFDGSSVSSVSSNSCTTTSPPFEKELQAAGLFTPRYLPLLDDNYFRPTSPPSPQDPSTSESQTSPQQVMPKLANIPSSSSRAGNTSPAYPLASSLKSSSGSSTSTMSKSGTRKQKSPKRVTFQFEDEDSVPSRSSPPTKPHRTLEDENYAFEDEDGSVEYEGEEAGEGEPGEKAKAEQAEHTAVETMVGGRFPGDELVVPTTIGGENSGVVQKSSGFNGLGISGILGSANGTNGNTGNSDSDDEPTRYDDDDDGEVALFDLDETTPEVNDDPAPPRDYSALTNSPQTVTNARLTASSFPMLPSFTPSVPAVPASASQSLLTFGKSPGPRPGLPRTRRGSLSSSLSPHTKQAQFQQEPIASSLPNFDWKGIDPQKSGFVPTPGGRFRRRSIVKYDLTEDDAAAFKGKGKGKGKNPQRVISEASDEEEDDRFQLSRSPNATSLPMSISRLSPAAFAAMSNKGRPQKPPSQPINKNDIPDPGPVTARPSPKLRSPLSAAASFPVQPMAPKVDSADILASMPSSFTIAENGSPEKNDSVSSYRRSSPFPSAYDRTPYRTAYAAEVAAAAALDDEADYGGALESVVGGVDGRTGLDPDISNFSYRASSLGPGGGSRGRSGSLAGAMEAVDPGRMSFGMRMAWETGKKEEVKRK